MSQLSSSVSTFPWSLVGHAGPESSAWLWLSSILNIQKRRILSTGQMGTSSEVARHVTRASSIPLALLKRNFLKCAIGIVSINAEDHRSIRHNAGFKSPFRSSSKIVSFTIAPRQNMCPPISNKLGLIHQLMWDGRFLILLDNTQQSTAKEFCNKDRVCVHHP